MNNETNAIGTLIVLVPIIIAEIVYMIWGIVQIRKFK